MQSQIKFILTDIGNVLVRLEWRYRERQLAARYGIDELATRHVIYFEDDRFHRFERGELSWDAYRELVFAGLVAIGATLGDDAHEHFSQIWRDLIREPIMPVAKMWLALRDRVRIVSVSNVDEHSYGAVARHPMVANIFHHETHSFRLGKRKGDHDYFVRLLERLEARPEECFFVDDLEAYVAAAANHGIRGHWFHEISDEAVGNLRAALVEAGIAPEWLPANTDGYVPC